MITALSYMYRDASNYKQHGEAYFEGRISFSERRAFAVHLSEVDGRQLYFLAEQVGLPNLREEWSTHFDDDHVWHEFVCFDILEKRRISTQESICDFVDRFCRTEWNTTLATATLTAWQRDTPVGH